MITQQDVNTIANIIKWGCLAPIAAVILLCLFWYIFSPFIDTANYGSVPELSFQYKITGDSYETDDGRTIHTARLYFSRTDTFETDYIDFHYTVVNYPRIYYVEPDTFYIVDRDSEHIQDIHSKEFNIVYIDRKSGDKKDEREDSVLRAKSYKFNLNVFCNMITIFDKQGKIIFKKNHSII